MTFSLPTERRPHYRAEMPETAWLRSHRQSKLIHHRRRLYAGECGSHSVRADVDDLRDRDRDLAVEIDQRLGIDDRHADEPPVSVEARGSSGRTGPVQGDRRLSSPRRGRASRTRMAMARNRKTKQGHLKFSSTAIQRTRNTMPINHTIQARGLRGQSCVSLIQTTAASNANTRKPHTKFSSTAHHRTRNTVLARAAIQTRQLCRQSWFTLRIILVVCGACRSNRDRSGCSNSRC
jgi:hypothetical protein